MKIAQIKIKYFLLLLIITQYVIGQFSTNNAYAAEPDKFYGSIILGYDINSIPTINTFQTQIITGLVMHDIISVDNGAIKASKAMRGFDIGAALGYNINDQIRIDLICEYIAQSNKGAKAQNNPILKERYFTKSTFDLTANLYYDVNTNTNFTPFITIGLGMEYARYRNKLTDVYLHLSNDSKPLDGSSYFTVKQSGDIDFDQTKLQYINMIKGKLSTDFLYQCGCGIAYKLAEDIFIDLLYRISNVPKTNIDSRFAKVDYEYDSSTLIPTAVRSQRIDQQNISRSYKNSLLAGIRVQF